MPWQQLVADVGCEIDPETGFPAYREVIVTVMRQNGKTSLVLAAELERCLMWGKPQAVAYTAQTGQIGRQKFKEDQKPMIESSSLSGMVRRFYLSDANTQVVFKNNSRISVLHPDGGHSKTLDMAVIDEAFEDTDFRREQALRPTMTTRPAGQIWVTSTAGTPASTYLRQKVDIGRAAVKAGKDTGIAYFEWAIPEDEDIYDPRVWARHMPAFGYTVSEPVIQGETSMPEGEFRRAYGNQWTETEERVIPAAWWKAVSAVDVQCESPLFVIEAKPDHSQACVVKADNSGRVELVAVREKVDWLLSEIPEKVGKSTSLVVDGHGPVAHIADDLEKLGYQVRRLDSLGIRKACGRFFDAIADQKVQVRTDERLDAAVAAAVKKSTTDSFSWHREAPGGELLMAASIAFASAVTEGDSFPPFAVV
jgi:phage terminase large subunit-like protein